MKSITHIDNNYIDPHSQFEHSPDHLGFFDNLRALDAVQFRTSLDDFYNGLLNYHVADTNAPVYAATDPVLSIRWQVGELKVPDTASYDVYISNNGSYIYSGSAQNVSPYYASSTPSVVQQDYTISSTLFHNAAYAGYSPPLYSTAQVQNVNSHSSTCNQLQNYHMDAGMSNNDIPFSYVMQSNQEPEALRASNQYTPTQQGYEYLQYTPDFSPVNELEYGNLPDTPFAQGNTPPVLYESDYFLPSALATSFPSTSSPIGTSFPTSSSDFAIPHYNQPVPSPSGSFIFNTPFPVSHDFVPVPNLNREPSPALPPSPVLLPIPVSTPQPVQKKRVTKSKKVTSITTAESQRRADKQRPRIRSQHWLDKYFDKAQGCCTLCGGGPSKYRGDRALEHLASKHVWQIVKNTSEFEKMKPNSLIKTPAQFAYTRERIEEMRCSICLHDTGLVMRKDHLTKHIDSVHRELPDSTRKAEWERVNELTQRKRGFYNFHDEFLYHFFHVS